MIPVNYHYSSDSSDDSSDDSDSDSEESNASPGEDRNTTRGEAEINARQEQKIVWVFMIFLSNFNYFNSLFSYLA